jgi:23S rRNA (adenine2030-N6)-methyltransferase
LGEAVLAPYFAALHARHGKRLARYPGSPALIAGSLRPQDRALFVELMPAEARAAEREIESAGRIRTQIGDGYAALKAFLPPDERRGLALIDPPYESIDELKSMLRAFEAAYRRWPTGIFLAWYPIRSALQRSKVHARFEALGIPKVLYADLAVHPDDVGVGLAGSGLMIVNPPYGTDEYLQRAYGAIHGGLTCSGAGYVEVARLTAERVAQ